MSLDFSSVLIEIALFRSTLGSIFTNKPTAYNQRIRSNTITTSVSLGRATRDLLISNGILYPRDCLRSLPSKTSHKLIINSMLASFSVFDVINIRLHSAISGWYCRIRFAESNVRLLVYQTISVDVAI